MARLATLIGDKELAATLDDLRRAAANSVMRPAVLSGAKVLRDAVKPVVHPTFQPHVTHRAFTWRKGGVQGIVEVGPRKAAEWQGRTIKVEGRDVPLTVAATFLEYAKRPGYSSNRWHGKVRAATVTARPSALVAVTDEARRSLDKQVVKSYRKGKTFGE